MATSTPTLSRPTPIDPRIQARRIEVQRGVGRRRLQRLVDVGLVLAVAAGFAIALRSPLLDVDAVRVAGAEHTPTAVVLEQAGIPQGEQLMDVDLRAAGERVAELPWVDEVHLHRGIDGTVDVTITERTPVAMVGEGDAAVLVDGEGRAVARATEAPEVAAAVVRFVLPDAPVAPGDYLPPSAEDAVALADSVGLDAGARDGARARGGGARSPRARASSSASGRPPTSTPRSGRCAPCWTRWISPARP